MQREVNAGHPFESKFHVDYSTNNHPSHHATDDLDCCCRAILTWRKPVGPRILRKLWSNLRQQGNEETETDDNSYLRGVESQLRAAAQRGYPNPENAQNPVIAPRDYDVRLSGRVLELQNRDLWIRPTDLDTFPSS